MRDLAGQLPDGGSDHLAIMAKAASHAGALLQEAFRRRHTLQPTEKSAGDFVSEADQAAETVIAEHLRTAYPNYGWLGEETGTSPGEGTSLRWVVDPLDGTTNFLKGLPHWAISIALCYDDEVREALVYNPETAELFTASRGRGAYLNGRSITVSPETELRSALFATGMPAGGRVTYLQATLDDLKDLMPLCAGIRRAGSAALDLAFVAAGRLDGYWERNLGAWDVAAGLLLVEEAGGLVSPLWQERSILSSGSFIASTKAFMAPLTDHISQDRA